MPRTTDIVVEGDSARLEEASAATADVTFDCDPEAFVLMIWGRESLDSAVADGRVTVGEANPLAAEFGRWATSHLNVHDGRRGDTSPQSNMGGE